MQFKRFSQKQLAALCWWLPQGKNRHYDAIICDGSVRSGKTLCLSLSFLLWSFASFRGRDFGICGKTIRSLHRNLVNPLLEIAHELGFKVNFLVSHNLITLEYGGVINRFYLFGGKDEGSSSLIQGVTLAGVLFDEVALMPRSFVEQALARCSVAGSRFWFNCNPEHPSHWFYLSWIKKAVEKNAYYLHFTMEDNPSLSPEILTRYENLYSGVFHDRYIKGLWTAAHGAVYPMFNRQKHVVDTLPEDLTSFTVSCDYGTTNPSSFGLWGYCEGESCWYRMREYYHCSRTTGVVKTDSEYYKDLEKLVGNLPVSTVIVDPSAASFIETIRSMGRFSVTPATNNVLDGIRRVSSRLSDGGIKFHSSCKNTIAEFSLYRWNLNAVVDTPVKENDHTMDEVRYFVMNKFADEPGGFYAVAKKRV